MSDNTIGKVMFVGLVIIAIWLISEVLTAKGEVARRFRLVVGAALLLGLGAAIIAVAGPGGLAITFIVVGAITWIIKGAKK